MKKKIKFPQNGTGNDVCLYLECCWKNNGYRWRAQFDGNDFEKARRLLSSTDLRFSDYNAVVVFLNSHKISCPRSAHSRCVIKFMGSKQTNEAALPCTTKQDAFDWLVKSWRKRYFREACEELGTKQDDFNRACRLFMSDCPQKKKYFYHNLCDFFKSVGVLLPKRLPERPPKFGKQTHKAPHFVSGGLCHGK